MKVRIPQSQGPSNMQAMLSVKIAEEVVDPDDIETLEDLIVAAVNEAIKKVESESQEEMAKITGSMNIPGMGGLF